MIVRALAVPLASVVPAEFLRARENVPVAPVTAGLVTELRATVIVVSPAVAAPPDLVAVAVNDEPVPAQLPDAAVRVQPSEDAKV